MIVAALTLLLSALAIGAAIELRRATDDGDHS